METLGDYCCSAPELGNAVPHAAWTVAEQPPPHGFTSSPCTPHSCERTEAKCHRRWVVRAVL